MIKIKNKTGNGFETKVYTKEGLDITNIGISNIDVNISIEGLIKAKLTCYVSELDLDGVHVEYLGHRDIFNKKEKSVKPNYYFHAIHNYQQMNENGLVRIN